MHSSTSSSDVQLVRADWARTWAATLIVALALLGAWEVFWRVKGFRPVVIDDPPSWAAAREIVRPDSVVLVGSSRMHADVHPAVFAQASGRHTVQLAVNGGLSYLVLEHLARDPNFKGTAICEMWEIEIVTGMTTRLEQSVIDAYQQTSVADKSESILRRKVQNYFAFALPQLAFPSVVQHVVHGKPLWPSSDYTVAADRTLAIDFTHANLEALRAKTATGFGHRGPTASAEEFIARARRFEALADKIEERGGRVIFVRLPVSGVIWDELEKKYPKKLYWDEFARRTRFATIHFNDYRELQFECPDYSHLDMRQASQFSSALGKILVEKELIRPQ